MALEVSWIVATIVIYVGLMIYVGYYAHKRTKRDSVESYVVSDRAMPPLVLMMTYAATFFSAYMMIGFAGYTFANGLAGTYGFEIFVTTFTGSLLILYVGYRYWILGSKRGYISSSELLGDRYGNAWVAVIATILGIMWIVPHSMMQFQGIAKLLDGLTGGTIPYLGGILLFAVVAFIYTVLGGVRAVAWTDVIQGTIMIVTTILMVVFVINALGGVTGYVNAVQSTAPDHLTFPGPNGFYAALAYLGIIIPFIFQPMCNPQANQRFFMARRGKDLKYVAFGFAIFSFIYTLLVTLFAIGGKALLPDTSPADSITPVLLVQVVPAIIALVAMCGVFSAALSTIDSQMLTLSSMFSRDIVKNSWIKKLAPSKEILATRIFMLAYVIVVFLLSWSPVPFILTLGILSAAGVGTLAPALLGAVFWKRGTAAGALSSMIIGSALLLTLQLTGTKPFGIAPGVWALVVSFLLYYLVSLATQAPKDKVDKIFEDLKSGYK